MKRIVLSFLLVIFSAAFFCAVAIESYHVCFEGGEGAGGYVNTCPGSQGNRQKQVVACRDDWFGEIQVCGCCAGGGNCYQMNPCNNQQSFRCGTGGWCPAE